MSGLIRAEWLRLRRRKDLWFVLAALAALTTIGYWGPLGSVDSHYGFDPTRSRSQPRCSPRWPPSARSSPSRRAC